MQRLSLSECHSFPRQVLFATHLILQNCPVFFEGRFDECLLPNSRRTERHSENRRDNFFRSVRVSSNALWSPKRFLNFSEVPRCSVASLSIRHISSAVFLLSSIRYIFLLSFGIRVYYDKCVLWVKYLTFLGHNISAEDVLSLQDRVSANRKFQLPKTQRQLWQFLGMTTFYHGIVLQLQLFLRLLLSFQRKRKEVCQPR